MKVAFFTRKWPPAIGGMETYSYKLSEKLKDFCELSVFNVQGRADGRPPSIFTMFFFIVKSFGIALFSSEKYDVIHLGDVVLWPVGLLYKISGKCSRVVITFYGLDLVYQNRPGIASKIYGFYFYLFKCFFADYIKAVAISSHTKILCEEQGLNEAFLINLGVCEADLAKPLQPRSIETGSSSPYRLVFVGRLVERKGLSWFVDNVLHKLDNEIKLLVIGKVWDASEALSLNNERVEYLGVLKYKAIQKIRRDSMAVIMPNINTDGLDVEGFGLTSIEALADGGIMIASALEGINDAILDRKTGFLVEAENVEAWVNLIHKVKNMNEAERETFISDGRKSAMTHYTWSVVAKKTHELYEEILK